VFSRFRRSYKELDENRVKAIRPTAEIMLALGRRAFVSPAQAERIDQVQSLRFQRRLARLVIRSGSDAVVCYDKNAFETFSRLEHKGVLLILDQSTAHPAFHEALLGEERRLCPSFADSIVLPSEKSVLHGRWRQEAEQADRILAGSSFVKETLAEQGIPEWKISVINYGVDPERFRPGPGHKVRDKFTVLFVGSIMQRKGIAYLLEAISRLDLTDLELVLCGNVAGTGAGLKPYARFLTRLGHVPHRDIPKVYQEADVFVMPSLVEGLSLTILEAMASGIPVIATPNTGALDLMADGEHGFIVPIRDSESIAERIDYLYRNRESCLDLGQAARRQAVNYSWARYGAQVGECFAALLSQEQA
jgi:glycosyltransferase involved in cell wall biosynthesis